MKARLETYDGKVTLKVFYDPSLCNWDEAIAAELASFGLKHGQAAVLALPFSRPGGGEGFENIKEIQNRVAEWD
jgi:hypothetical protein